MSPYRVPHRVWARILFPRVTADPGYLAVLMALSRAKGQIAGKGSQSSDCRSPVTFTLKNLSCSKCRQRPKCPSASATPCLRMDVSMPPPKPQPAKMWSLSKNQYIFAWRKRNAWRHLPKCYHQAKPNPGPKERQEYWRTHFLHKIPFWRAIFSRDWENTLGFSAQDPSAHHGLLPVHGCKSSYCCSELIQLCSPSQSGSCWLLQLLHFWSPALTALLQAVGTAWRKPIKI